MSSGYIKRLTSLLLREYPKHVYATKGPELGLKAYARVIRWQKGNNAPINNNYLKLCLRHNQLTLIDQFVELFDKQGVEQQLSSLLPIFTYLYTSKDHDRVSRYAKILPQLGELEGEISQLSILHRYQTSATNDLIEQLERKPSLNEVEEQVFISALLDAHNTDRALRLFRPSLFSANQNPAFASVRRANLRKLLGQMTGPDPIMQTYASFLKELQTVTKKKTTQVQSKRSTWWLWEVVRSHHLNTKVTRAQQIIGVDLQKGLANFATILRQDNFQDDALIDRYVRICIKKDAFDQLDLLIPELVDTNRSFNLPSFFNALKSAYKAAARDRVSLYESFLPRLLASEQNRYTLYKLRATGCYHQLIAKIDEASALTSSEQAALLSSALIQTNQPIAAERLAKLALFSGEISHADFLRKARMVIDVARMLIERNIVFETFVERRIIRQIPTEQDDDAYSQLVLFANAYHLANDDLEASRVLLEATDLTRITTRYAAQTCTWLLRHTSVDEALAFLEVRLSAEPNNSNIVFAYASTLLEANRAEVALDTLAPVSQEAPLRVALLRLQLQKHCGQPLTDTSVIRELAASHCDNEGMWNTLFKVCETDLIKEVYLETKDAINPSLQIRLSYKLAIETVEVEPSWSQDIAYVAEHYTFSTAAAMLQAAFVLQQAEHFDRLYQLISDNLPDPQKYSVSDQVTVLFTLLYKRGLQRQARALADKFDCEQFPPNLQVMVKLSIGDIVAALDLRSKMMSEKVTALLNRDHRRGGAASKTRVLCPEKDLAGELYNSFLFHGEVERAGTFTVVCDSRLQTIFARNFPELTFVPKAPPRTRAQDPDRFRGVPLKLCDFFDNHSLQQTINGELFAPRVQEAYIAGVNQGFRTYGWLRPDADALSACKKQLRGIDGKTAIGFSPASTLSSPTRDLHYIDLSYWGPIFSLPDVVFVNLNSSLSSDDIDQIAAQNRIEVLQPEIDLHNDFEGLIALLSSLDFGILPANSLMDFASSVALPSLIFSPSGIMRNWLSETGRYIFSDAIEFLHGQDATSKEHLVDMMAVEVRQKIDARLSKAAW